MSGARRAAAVLVALLALLAAACAGGPEDASPLLLAPEDFQGAEVVETSRQAVETAEGESAAQVSLEGPDFQVGQSLVLFEEGQKARSVLEGIKQTRSEVGTPSPPPGDFQDASGVITEERGGVITSTLFFVEGRSLVRLNVSGPRSAQLLETYAEKARRKASR